MQDINFDELDKAVNSVLKSSDNKTSTGDSMADSTLGNGVAEGVVDKPTARPVSAITSQRRRGQFMDMVHPSSDMTSTNPRRGEIFSPEHMRRQSPSIKPLPTDIMQSPPKQPEEPALMPSVDRTDISGHVDEDDLRPMINESNDAQNRATEIASAEQALENDGIDYEINNEADAFVSSAAPRDESESNVEASSPVEESDTSDHNVDVGYLVDSDVHDESSLKDDRTQVSPFVDSAEVEKRPLGAFSDNSETRAQNDEVSENHDLVQEDGDATREEPNLEVAEAIPNELHPDIVSVEADVDSSDTEDYPSANGQMQSIPQQYKTNDHEDNTDDEHAVFDTKQYYQPLDPPAKKKNHMLLYIILLVLMVAVGSAIGYLVWVLKLF